MRKVTLFLAMMISLTIGAQKFRHHEFSATLGFGANLGDKEVSNMYDYYVEKYNLTIGGDCPDYNIMGKSFLTLNLEYHYRLNKLWAIGTIMGFGRSYENYGQSDETPITIDGKESQYLNSKYGEGRSNLFYLALSVRRAWFIKGNFRLYSRVALGTMRQHTSFDYEEESSDEVKWKMAYQLTPLGFDFGIEPIRVYSELGYGFQGVFNIGARLAF